MGTATAAAAMTVKTGIARRPPKGGFTLIEMLVVIAIIGVLAAIFAPLLSGMRARGRLVYCAANLRQVGVAVKSYLMDNNNVFPPIPFGRWFYFGEISEYYRPYLDNSYDVFICLAQRNDLRVINPGIPFPSNPGRWPTYEYNSFFAYSPPEVRTLTTRHVTDPSICAYVYDYPYYRSGSFDFRPHSGGMNVLYLDWHVSFLREEDYGSGTNVFYLRGHT